VITYLTYWVKISDKLECPKAVNVGTLGTRNRSPIYMYRDGAAFEAKGGDFALHPGENNLRYNCKKGFPLDDVVTVQMM